MRIVDGSEVLRDYLIVYCKLHGVIQQAEVPRHHLEYAKAQILSTVQATPVISILLSISSQHSGPAGFMHIHLENQRTPVSMSACHKLLHLCRQH